MSSAVRAEVGHEPRAHHSGVGPFPEVDVITSEQRYTRLATDRWRYRSGECDYELVTDPSSGLVLSYGDDLWRATAISLS
jgi:hypothetical protein